MGVLINGEYHPDMSPDDLPSGHANIADMAADSRLMNEARRHDIDLVQPYLPGGEPNPDFIKFYPKEAKEYGFTEK